MKVNKLNNMIGNNNDNNNNNNEAISCIPWHQGYSVLKTIPVRKVVITGVSNG